MDLLLVQHAPHPSYMAKVYTIQVWLFLHQNYVLYRIDNMRT